MQNCHLGKILTIKKAKHTNFYSHEVDSMTYQKGHNIKFGKTSAKNVDIATKARLFICA